MGLIHRHMYLKTCRTRAEYQAEMRLLNADFLLVGMQSVAAEALTYACDHCHKDALQQKSRILQFLIPVQMLLGKLPSAAIREKYNMHMYDTIIEVRVPALAVVTSAVTSVTECGAQCPISLNVLLLISKPVTPLLSVYMRQCMP